MGYKKDEYKDYVEHPRYGRRPDLTGLNPQEQIGKTNFHWHSRKNVRIENTAIVADVSKQPYATVPVTHYFDEKRVCRECGRPFLFFAREQKYWYEVLRFKLEATCACCIDCRKEQQEIARIRARYEALVAQQALSPEEVFELVRCGIDLINESDFTSKKISDFRGRLNAIAADLPKRLHNRHQRLLAELKALEATE